MFRLVVLMFCAALAGCTQEQPAAPAAVATPAPQVVEVALQEPPAPLSSPFADCPAGLQAVHLVAPEMPRETEMNFGGEATVTFVIEPTGAVADARIESADWGGRRDRRVRLLEEAILVAVAQWRYPSQATPCFQRAPVRISLPD